ncbi:MAG TPA: 30S ribosomal protein S13 [Candidatus Binatia bacterium]|nr:30S ribosomal protein S13 [Candidatus Binatia bacterium]
MAENLRHIVRIANTDLKGTKHILYALADIKGVGVMYANAVCAVAGTDTRRKVGSLTDEEVRRMDEIIKNPLKFGIPEWLLDRRKDPETGIDKHVVTNDLVFVQENDVKMMKKMKSWKGIRHILDLPVRGQRVRSNFRKNKGNVMGVKVATKKSGTT